MCDMKDDLNKLALEAQNGSQSALERLVRAVQDRVHHLAMRMLVNPDDALEATQEILILVVTKLSTFRSDSAFHTWLYRVATNYLLTARKIANRNLNLSFEIFAADLENGLLVDQSPPAADVVMLNELRISCTMAMLLCLDLNHRIAYVLGDILELEHTEAAEILGISKDNFRKRLSRARGDVVAFTLQRCGLASERAKCSCPRRLPAAIANGRVSTDHQSYVSKDTPQYEDVIARVKDVEGELKVLKLQTATPFFRSPQDLGARIAQIVQGNP